MFAPALTLLLLLVWNQAVWAAGPAPAPGPVFLNDPVAGQALATDLRNARPASASQFTGLLRIRPRGEPASTLPLVSRILPGTDSWEVFYQVTSNKWTETLIVKHSPGMSNEYRFARQEGTNALGSSPPRCQEIWQPFAGSDFALADLGLEFFHWPTQILVLNEMRKSRACHVLESRPALAEGYARVVSWVDVETGGVLLAEAYNVRNQRLKEFEVREFKKSGDHWQVQEIEMRHFKGGQRTNSSRTTLVFDRAGP
jgi:hypothetical protein